MQYIYGTDTVQQAFNKVNENFSNVPSGTTTEILQQAQEYTDSVIANPNLPINSNFIIWQRGASFSQANFTEQYTADMWTVSCSDSSVTVTVAQVNNGMSITGSTSSTINLKYYMEQADLNKILGQNCTLSYSINNTITTAPLTVSSGAVETTALINISIPISATATVINWVKLELGNIATQYVPKSYAQEIFNCQRYFVSYTNSQMPILTALTGLTAGNLYIILKLPREMRTLPTVTGNYYFDVRGNGGTLSRAQYSNYSTIEDFGNGTYRMLFTGLDTGQYPANYATYGIIIKANTINFDANIY